jgi:hypothetical protein
MHEEGRLHSRPFHFVELLLLMMEIAVLTVAVRVSVSTYSGFAFATKYSSGITSKDRVVLATTPNSSA